MCRYDKTHVCSVQYYRACTFTQPCIRKGDFIEDTFGKEVLADIRKNGE